MTKQEQVKEILEVIKHCGDYTNRDCAECDYRLYGECKNQKQCEAEALYNAGYRKIDALKAENRQLKTECALLDDELRIARQDTIDVLNELKTKLFTIFGKTICSDLDTEDITDIIDELLKEYE